MNKLIRRINRLNIWLLTLLFAVCTAGCGGDDEEEELLSQGGSQNSGKGSIMITNIVARGKSTTGLQIDVTVKTSGVKPDEVITLGVKGGTSKNAEGSLRASIGGGQTSGTLKIVSGLRSETTYYIKAYMKTKEGTVYSSIKSVTTR